MRTLMAVKRVNGIVYANLDDPAFVEAPSFGGSYRGRVWEIDRSADGRRSIALFEQTGELDFEYTCDEVFLVRRGSMDITFEDGKTATVREGDVVFFPKGTKGHFSLSEDFSDLTIFLSTDDQPVDII
jgi:uncharacterized cupin superfamily protein